MNCEEVNNCIYWLFFPWGTLGEITQMRKRISERSGFASVEIQRM